MLFVFSAVNAMFVTCIFSIFSFIPLDMKKMMKVMSLNLAVYNAVMDLGQAPNNKLVTKKSSSQNSFGRKGGDSCKRDTSTAEVLFTQLQLWSQATGENVLVETETSMPEPVYSEL